MDEGEEGHLVLPFIRAEGHGGRRLSVRDLRRPVSVSVKPCVKKGGKGWKGGSGLRGFRCAHEHERRGRKTVAI